MTWMIGGTPFVGNLHIDIWHESLLNHHWIILNHIESLLLWVTEFEGLWLCWQHSCHLFQIETSWNMLNSILPPMEFRISSLIIIFRIDPYWSPHLIPSPSPAAPKTAFPPAKVEPGAEEPPQMARFASPSLVFFRLDTDSPHAPQARPATVRAKKRSAGGDLLKVTQLVISMWFFRVWKSWFWRCWISKWSNMSWYECHDFNMQIALKIVRRPSKSEVQKCCGR